jgi:hypothetical protein
VAGRKKKHITPKKYCSQRLSLETVERAKEYGRYGDSIDDAIARAIDIADSVKKKVVT